MTIADTNAFIELFLFTLNTCQFCMNFNSLEFYLKTLYRFTIQSKRLQRYHENYELYIFRNIVVSVHNYHENGVAHLGLVSKDILVNLNDNFYQGRNFNELGKLLLELVRRRDGFKLFNKRLDAFKTH